MSKINLSHKEREEYMTIYGAIHKPKILAKKYKIGVLNFFKLDYNNIPIEYSQIEAHYVCCDLKSKDKK